MVKPTAEFVFHRGRLAKVLREVNRGLGYEDDSQIECSGESGSSKLDWLATVLSGEDGDVAPDDDAPFLDCPFGLEMVVYPIDREYDDVCLVTVRPKDGPIVTQVSTISCEPKHFLDWEGGLGSVLDAAEALTRQANELLPQAVKLWDLA